MSRESEAIEDIRRLLAMTWRTWGNEPLDPNSITRTWSLDLGWLSPQDSENLLTKLIAKGWLESSDLGLSPKSDYSKINVPLGWFPRQRLIEDPPIFPLPKEKIEKVVAQKNNQTNIFDKENETKKELTKEPKNDNREFDVINLLQMISKESKLSQKTIMERAQEKRKSLGHLTIWMALFLVARELSVNVKDLLD
tara:strand:- start:69 stop:653 length:585 start_codon:yes stop_codon:yes gene_type:complete